MEKMNKYNHFDNLPSANVLADYMNWISLDHPRNLDDGASKYNVLGNLVNYPNNAGSSSSSNCATNYPFTTSNSLSYNMLNSNNNSKGPSFKGIHDHVPNLAPYEAYSPFLMGVRALNGPNLSEYMVGIRSIMSLDHSSLCQLACTFNGSKQLEKLIKRLGTFEFVSFLNLAEALASEFLDVAFNSFGRRVLLQCFKDLGIREKRVLSNKVVQHCISMATNKSRCILLNSCILDMEETFKDRVLSIINHHSRFLAQDRYGTYVIQNVVSMDDKRFSPLIVMNLRGIIPTLSIQREGSHLVEKCLDCLSTKRIVVELFLALRKECLCKLACNEFGNFVIQKALSSTSEQPEFLRLHWRLHKVLYSTVDYLKLHRFGKIVASKLVYDYIALSK